jgi:hypothetical protein
MQIDQIYGKIQKEIEEKRYDFNLSVENWFALANNNSELILRDVIYCYKF